MSFDTLSSQQIRAAHRQGNGTKIQMFGSGTPVAGNVALYDANGNLIPGSVGASIDVLKNGTLIGTRSKLNLIEGSNVTLTVADDAGNNRVNATIAAAGGGGSGSIAYRTWAQHLTDTVEGISILRDSPYIAISDGGSPASWLYWLPNVGEVTIPNSADYTWDNQGTATVASTYGPMLITGPTGAGTNLRILYKSAPTAPYTITFCFEPGVYTNFANAGFVHRQSSDGKCRIFSVMWNNNNGFIVDNFTNSSTYNATPVAFSSDRWQNYNAQRVWGRVADDNTNITYSLQIGAVWVPVYTIARTTFLTPNQYGFFVMSNGATVAPVCRVIHVAES